MDRSTLITSMDGEWMLAYDPENIGRERQWWKAARPGAKPTQVPWIVQDAFPECYGVFWYWREFAAAENPHEHGRYLLRFWAVDYLADVWVNDVHVGGHEGGETPFTLDVTGAIKLGGTNRVCVRVLNPTNEPIDGILLAETPHSNKSIPYINGTRYNYGGIIESVELIISPPVRVADLYLKPDVESGEIRIETVVRNADAEAHSGRIDFVVAPSASGEALGIASIEREFPVGDTLVKAELSVPGHQLWDLASPCLYRVTARVRCSESVDERSARCGFRDFRVENGYFRLNGKRIFLKSTHTGNHTPAGQIVSPKGYRDVLLQDLLYAKALGFNTVRFIAGMAHPYQLDYCDEIGLMVQEETMAGWRLAVSPRMAERFDFSTREMILRDRNHPCVTIWGLLNETIDDPVYRHAKNSLPLIRSIDDTRLVLLSSGRWDYEASVGSVSNPGSSKWEHEWGVEAPDAPNLHSDIKVGPGYIHEAGDVHIYPDVPHTDKIMHLLRTLGKDTKPVFVSEYGIGSLINIIREYRLFEQWGHNLNAEDAALLKEMSDKFLADWKAWGFEGTYPFPEDILRDSQRLMAKWRSLGFDLIRSNPKICGFNVTGMLDHGFTGEGIWTFWREWKPGVVDAVSEGWAPLRWCLFADPMHGYSNGKFRFEAVLANEDVLNPGDYPVCFKVSGPSGVVWEHNAVVTIPKPGTNGDGPLAVPVMDQEVSLDVPAGEYELVANMASGGAPAGGRLKFYVSDPSQLPKVDKAVTLWGVDRRIEDWLKFRGVKCRHFKESAAGEREVILVGDGPDPRKDRDGWVDLAGRMARGSTVIFASPSSHLRAPESLGSFRVVGEHGRCSGRAFTVPNVLEEEQEDFNTEYFVNAGTFGYALSELPDDNYTVELGMCEAFFEEPGKRIFNVYINGSCVLKEFEVLKVAGGINLAVIRRFQARPIDGKITIDFEDVTGGVSLYRLRVLDGNGNLVVQDSEPTRIKNAVGWLPLEKKGRCYEFWDWLYHKECCAKLHPIFDGLPAKGILDWDYYGQVVSHGIYDGIEAPDDVAVAAFSVGNADPGGYSSGIMVCSYPFGAGRFILNTLRVLEHIDVHPVADRLLLNMINYAASLAQGPAEPLPSDFQSRLKAIGYEY